MLWQTAIIFAVFYITFYDLHSYFLVTVYNKHQRTLNFLFHEKRVCSALACRALLRSERMQFIAMLVRIWFGSVLGIAFVTGYSQSLRSDLIVDTLSHFQVDHCILLLGLRDVDLGPRMKQLAMRNIYTTIMNGEELTQRLFGSLAPPYKEAVVGDLDTAELISILPLAYHPGKFSKLLWLIFFSGNLETIGQIHVPYDCEFILARDEGEDYKLYEFYAVKNKIVFRHFGDWNKHTGLSVSSLPFYKRRYNFHGAQLVMLRFQENLCANNLECSHLDIWDSMGEMMNFSTKKVTMEELREQNLEEDVVSLVTVYHAVGLYKDPYLLFSIAPIWKIPMHFYVRLEADRVSMWKAYSAPFSEPIWLLIAISLIVASICLVLISRYNGSGRSHSLRFPLEFGFTPLDSICNQCGSQLDDQISKRMAVTMTRLLAIVVYPSYAGAIISFLTVQYPMYPFTDLQSFADVSSYKLGSLSNTFGIGYFEYSQDPTARKIVAEQLVNQSEMPKSYAQGMKRCCTEKFAFIAHADVLRNMGELPCRILKIPKPAYTTFAGMHLAAFSQFQSVFFHNLIKFQSVGMIDKLDKKIKLMEFEDQKHDEVEFRHVIPLFAVMLGGALASLTILVAEKCMGKTTKRESAHWKFGSQEPERNKKQGLQRNLAGPSRALNSKSSKLLFCTKH